MKFLLTFVFFTTSFFLMGQSYQSAESVEYDTSQNRWLISNGNNLLQRASDGTLSFFGTGIGSHGMEVMGNVVYVLAGGSVLNAYDLETEEPIFSLVINGASFLNGLTNDGQGMLYATDFSAKKIYKIDVTDASNPTFEIIVNNTSVTPNGILYDEENNRLLWVTWGGSASIRAVDLTDNSLSVVQTTTLSNIDGIDEDNEQNYYIASWGPARITKYDKTFTEIPEIVTTPALNNPADIGYSLETDTLAIPMGNSVIYVGLGTDPISSINDSRFEAFDMSIYPNPVSESSVIQFHLEKAQKVSLVVYDINGKEVYTLLEGQQPLGLHKVVLAGIGLSEGMYLCRLQTEIGEQSISFLMQK